jgi:hypothetical protein
VPADDGLYAPGETPRKERLVHSLEHGRIEIQYRRGTSRQRRRQLEQLYLEKVKGLAAYHTLLFENRTGMPYAVAATAWRRLLGCKRWNPRVIAAIRTFRRAYVDKAPEFIP